MKKSNSYDRSWASERAIIISRGETTYIQKLTSNGAIIYHYNALFNNAKCLELHLKYCISYFKCIIIIIIMYYVLVYVSCLL